MDIKPRRIRELVHILNIKLRIQFSMLTNTAKFAALLSFAVEARRANHHER